MESPSSAGGESSRFAVRSSFVDSLRGCGLSGVRIDKEDLKRKLLIPEYIRQAMRAAIRFKDPNAGVHCAVDGNVEVPEAPMVVFVNSRSGGRLGNVFKGRLQELMSEDQVYDLSVVKPLDFVRYGLSCLENMASLGDYCADEVRQKLRIMVAGGDGTVGWVLGSLAELHRQKRPIPPTGIIPLGTGNDLSRSFGWGGSFPFAWKSAVKRSLDRAVNGRICRLDSWHVMVCMPDGETVNLPYSLRHTEECLLDQTYDVMEKLPEKATCYEGEFYNYLSIGMDAQVAYGFHHLRDEKPYLAQGPIANKNAGGPPNRLYRPEFKIAKRVGRTRGMREDCDDGSILGIPLIYSGYGCTQGWFCTPCLSDPSLRGLNNILRLSIKKVNCSEWEHIPVPSSVRAIVALNLHHYGSGKHPWGNPSPEYLEKRGFVEAHADDGLLEIFGLKQGWHASFVMVELISAKHIAQAAAVRFQLRGGEWKQAFMQMDGEPWKQLLNKDYSTLVEIKRVPFQSVMINGE